MAPQERNQAEGGIGGTQRYTSASAIRGAAGMGIILALTRRFQASEQQRQQGVDPL